MFVSRSGRADRRVADCGVSDDSAAMTELRSTASPVTWAEPEPVWTVAATAARLGVAAPTLRNWSRRYGIGPAAHLAGRHRRYTADDLAELDMMRGLVQKGMAVPAAAAIARTHRPSSTPGGQAPAVAVRDLVAAGRALDPVAAAAVVSAALARFGVVATWNELCRPALAAFDNPLVDRPAADGGSTGPGSGIEAELVVSRAVATGLHRLPTPPAPAGARRVLLAGTRDEHHTLGLEALFAALVERGLDARLLGPSVDDRVLCDASAALGPVIVVVWAQVPATASSVLIHAPAVRGVTLVVAAGPGWARAPLDPDVRWANSLQDAINSAVSA